MQKKFALSVALSCVLVCLTAFVGCGPRDGLCQVTGTVTLDGVPLESGTINMGPMAGQHGVANGAKIENGLYTVRVSAGEMAVSIYSQKSEKIENPTEDDIAHGITERRVELLPEKYNRRSELRCTVSEGKNTIDFELTSDK